MQECLEGIFESLCLNNESVPLLQQPELDQILIMGEALTRCTRTRHFSDPDGGQTPHILTSCGPWHDDAGQVLTISLCKDYWSLLDPLRDLPNPLSGMHAKLHRSLRKFFRARNLPVPDLPQYKQLPRKAAQQDASRLG